MEVMPAIDLMGGRCVQLVGGRPETKVDYGSPPEVALKWKSAGARILHVVDLDAALGLGDNLEEVKRIKETSGLGINFGGGIRSVDYASKALDSHADKVILGTMVVEDMKKGFPAVKELSGRYGSDRIIASVDSREGFVSVKGWSESTHLKAADLMNKAGDFVWGFLYTNVDVEGRMRGVDMGEIKKVVGSTEKPVIVSGGITTKGDIEEIESCGAWGVVLGKALYEGKIDLADLMHGGLGHEQV